MKSEEGFNQMLDAKKRHEERLDNIINECGYSKILNKKEKIDKIVYNNERILNNIRESLYKIIGSRSNKKRITIDKEITIRDDSIYQYGSSRDPELSLVAENFDSLSKKANLDVDERNKINKVFNSIINMKEDSNYFSSMFYKTRARKYKPNKYIVYQITSKKLGTTQRLYKILDCESHEEAISEVGIKNKIKFGGDRHSKLEISKTLSPFKKEIEEIINNSHKEVEEVNDSLDSLLSYLNEEFRDELFLEAL